MRRHPAFHVLITCLALLASSQLAFSQQAGIAYSWQAGALAFAYPATWELPLETTTSGGVRLELTDPSHPDTFVVIETIALPERRVFDLMAARLADAGVSVGAPTNTTLAGIVALEVHERDPQSARVGIGTGTNRSDGSALLIWGTAPREHGNALLVAFDQIVDSLVEGTWQMPRLPDGSPYTRIGEEQLQPGVPAYGIITPENRAQRWSYAGTGGDMISLYAVDINRTQTLNLRLRLAAPEGTIIAENDNHSGGAFYGLFSLYDAGLYDVTLPMDGVYTIQVEGVFGEGVYAVGVQQAGSVALAEGEATRIFGSISDVFANQTWVFRGTAGAVYTFTMFAESNTTLDPALRLFAPDGRLLAQNDDARDPSLGLNAQLVRVELPQDGIYRLEATRYAGEGEGAYEIVILEVGG